MVFLIYYCWILSVRANGTPNGTLIKASSSSAIITTEDITNVGDMLHAAHITDSEWCLKILEEDAQKDSVSNSDPAINALIK